MSLSTVSLPMILSQFGMMMNPAQNSAFPQVVQSPPKLQGDLLQSMMQQPNSNFTGLSMHQQLLMLRQQQQQQQSEHQDFQQIQQEQQQQLQLQQQEALLGMGMMHQQPGLQKAAGAQSLSGIMGLDLQNSQGMPLNLAQLQQGIANLQSQELQLQTPQQQHSLLNDLRTRNESGLLNGTSFQNFQQQALSQMDQQQLLGSFNNPAAAGNLGGNAGMISGLGNGASNDVLGNHNFNALAQLSAAAASGTPSVAQLQSLQGSQGMGLLSGGQDGTAVDGGLDPVELAHQDVLGQLDMAPGSAGAIGAAGNNQMRLQQQLLLAGGLNQPNEKNRRFSVSSDDHFDEQVGNSLPADIVSSLRQGSMGGFGMRAPGLPQQINVSHADPPVPKGPRKKRAKTFPEKLMDALMKHATDEAVAWLPDGKSFVIVNDDEFVKEVLNKDFKAAKYSSFVRKLHRWGFVRLTSGTGTDCFHHPLFQKNRLDLASRITSTPRGRDPSGRGQRVENPPSLAGVERFIRAKADAANAIAHGRVGGLPVDEDTMSDLEDNV